jgi:hypothetical protein
LTAWAIATQLATAGHQVDCVVLHDEEYFDPQGATLEQRVTSLESHGIGVHTLMSKAGTVREEASRSWRARAGRAHRPADAELYPHLLDAESVRSIVDGLEPDAAFAYHFDVVAASRLIAAPRVAGVGDPTHLPALYRLRRELPHPRAVRYLLAQQGHFRHQRHLMVKLLNECAASGAFAAHHAAWLRRRGVAGCEYFRTPVPDPGLLPDDAPTHGPVRIVLLGHLRGIATLSGLDVFARMLPELDKRLGRDGYEARIVGGGVLPDPLKESLTHPSVTFAGHTDNATEELRRAHCLLVPTSIPLGIRVRIITGLAHGNVIVTHAANAKGIPELQHDVNALIGRTPRELAAAVERTTDAALRSRLRAGARETYEMSFAPSRSVGHIERLLVRASGRDAPAPERLRG